MELEWIMAATIRLATIEDSDQIAAIYSRFVTDTPVSFEAAPPTGQEMARRIASVLESYPWLVCEIDRSVAGFANASRHRERYHYRWSVDVSVYIHDAHRRMGIGRALYTSLLNVLPMQGYVSAYAGITLPNPGSVGLHEAMGFKPVGIYQNVGFKHGSWHDVGWWQKTLVDPPAVPHVLLPLDQVTALDDWQNGIERGVNLLLN